MSLWYAVAYNKETRTRDLLLLRLIGSCEARRLKFPGATFLPQNVQEVPVELCAPAVFGRDRHGVWPAAQAI
jgi:hypothetical protein